MYYVMSINNTSHYNKIIHSLYEACSLLSLYIIKKTMNPITHPVTQNYKVLKKQIDK